MKANVMNEASRWRLALAKRVSEIYCEHADVKAVAVGGSVARGIADAYSDIDMPAFCKELPSEDSLEALSGRIKGAVWRPFRKSDMAIASELYIDSVRVDMPFIKIDRMLDVLDQVVEQHSTDPSKQKSVGGILDAIPIHGFDLIDKWKAKAAEYPNELAKSMVKKHLQFEPLWVPREYAVLRESKLFECELICAYAKNILGVLLGLNRIYHPGDLKRLDWLVGRMSIVPRDLLSRLREAFQANRKDVINDLSKLIEEIIDLVNTKEVRKSLNSSPYVCTIPPTVEISD